MHEGCSGDFSDGKAIVDKVRMMGFSPQPLPIPLPISCVQCGKPFEMATFETECPDCGAVHGVTPCHAFDPINVKSAGIGY